MRGSVVVVKDTRSEVQTLIVRKGEVEVVKLTDLFQVLPAPVQS
tara:strand:- start:156 stop:287 length:132 start_codon:yes stop_codon:yes gene_type:complete